jgi:hypothetical protein
MPFGSEAPQSLVRKHNCPGFGATIRNPNPATLLRLRLSVKKMYFQLYIFLYLVQ